MSATDIESGLQTINAGVTGVKSAPTQMPGYLDSVMLPCALSYPGPSEPIRRSFAQSDEWREWITRLYGASVGSGRAYDEGYHDTLAFLARFRNEYITQQGESNANWCQFEYQGDNGVVMMGLHGSNTEPLFWVIEFTIRIKEASG